MMKHGRWKVVGLFAKLAAFMDDRVETSDHHADARLRTHYYKASKDKTMAALQKIFEEQKFVLLDLSSERGELSATVGARKKDLLVATIIPVGPSRTAVDFTYSVERGWNAGVGQKLISALYRQLDEKLTRAED
jgi:hypothetical protein